MESLNDYITIRLLKAEYTSFTDPEGNTQNICASDAQPRISRTHTLERDGGKMTFSNIGNGVLQDAMIQFYGNSLIAGEPITATHIICRSSLSVPSYLTKVTWEHDNCILFNEKTGLLTDKWWHIYGFTSLP